MEEISLVLDAIGQADIERALLFAKREVALAMNGESEDAGVATEDVSGAVSLMNVEIDDGGAADASGVAEELDGDSDIVKDAEAGAFAAKSVMCAAAQSATPAGGEGVE